MDPDVSNMISTFGGTFTTPPEKISVSSAKDAKEKFKEDIYLLMGGFHLKNKTSGEIAQIIMEFKRLGIQKIAPLHCTGKLAVGYMKTEFGKDFIRKTDSWQFFISA